MARGGPLERMEGRLVARDEVLRPFFQGKEVDLEQLRTATRMLAGNYNQLAKLTYMKKSLGNPSLYY